VHVVGDPEHVVVPAAGTYSTESVSWMMIGIIRLLVDHGPTGERQEAGGSEATVAAPAG
jgi:hypothetical protein